MGTAEFTTWWIILRASRHLQLPLREPSGLQFKCNEIGASFRTAVSERESHAWLMCTKLNRKVPGLLLLRLFRWEQMTRLNKATHPQAYCIGLPRDMAL
jgi:hypothetical protein